MSQIHPTASSSSNLQAIFCASLDNYKKRTKKDLLAHPFMVQLQTCNSPTDILTVLRTQVQQFERSTSGDDRLTRWLNPTVNVLYAFSAALGEGVGLVFSPAKVIFAGAGVLLLAAKDIVASQDMLIKIFERIESFFRRLEEYISVPTTEAMKETIVKIMVEVLGTFGIVTKEINQGRAKKYLKKLIGRRDIEDALVRLDGLTQQEAQMAIVQILKVAHHVKDGVQAVGEQVQGVDDNVKGVDDRVKKIDEKVNVAIGDGKETQALLQRTAINIDEEKRSRVRKDHRAWLSPLDPSTNQNIASTTQHEGTATWFSKGSIFVQWKTKPTTSLLWIHGKPGSGKSILCSAIIQDITALRAAGLASMAYFYFDFKDTDKQNIRNLLPSLLTQLSARSDNCSDILSRVYKAHDDGAHKPNISTLIGCLKEMLTLPSLGPIYIILDALDECPNTSGIPPDRKQVLDLIKDLIGLRLSDFHICITSRPENDIRDVLEPLAFHPVSIHEESGQKKDIEDYIKYVVYAESDTAMKRWREKDKELVIGTLTDRADGMFRWVFCQLEVLQHCLPQSIRRTLNELPKSLDETYERVLKEIRMANRDHAHRLLQCLTAAVRPLRVAELAEILALDFEDAEGATPKWKEDWRWEDRHRAVLSTCSSLITEVDDGYSRVVQFTHFSVKEFLTSDRLATCKGDASYFHITPDSAHTTLAHACLGTLLQLDGSAYNSWDEEDRFPLARYASQHWVEHAQFGNVSSRIEDGMRLLFDSTKLHFNAWLQLYDIDDRWPNFGGLHKYRESPLYYASLCGFHDLAAHIIVEHPEQVNVRSGFNHSPLAAALYKRHFDVAELLYRHGAAVDIIDESNRTLLHAASLNGRIDVARWLLDHGADANPCQIGRKTPIHFAASYGHLEIVRMLLGHNVPVNTTNSQDHTPLHNASRRGHVGIVVLLLEHGAAINAQDNEYSTPLHLASGYGRLEATRLLLDRGANAEAKKKDGWTPLHEASSFDGVRDIVRLLLDHGANPNAEDNDGWTPLHLASLKGKAEIARLLLDCGANADPKKEGGMTPLHEASSNDEAEIVRLLLDRGANVDSKKEDGRTPLHDASFYGIIEMVQLLLDHDANANAEDKDGWTPLHVASSERKTKIVRLLLNRGASADTKDSEGNTPLHEASSYGTIEIVQLLLDHDANVNAKNKRGWTPLHVASSRGDIGALRFLLDRGASAGAKDKQGETPFQVASRNGHGAILQELMEHGGRVECVL